jgi:hexosaminidase
MHPAISFGTCLSRAAAALALAAAAAGAGAPPLDVMPAPAEAAVAPGRIAVSAGPLSAIWLKAPDERLVSAFRRAETRWEARLGGPNAVSGPGPGTHLYIECDGPGPGVPALDQDESYSLAIGEGRAKLRAPNALGVLHGLETFLQLLRRDEAGWYLPAVSIKDRPRFPWRGLMIDVARHWQPVAVIKRNLDAMAVVKLNVLHLHLTDDQGFRIESRTHPELQAQGSDGHFFTQEEIRGIIAYAAERGIRVLPEFDVPGHATSWVVSHPELASLPGPYQIERHWGVFNPVLDPTQEATYALLGDFLGEMAALFPDRFIHIGGDENNGVQWNANPRIQAFIRAQGLRDNEGLHAYFNRRVAAILAKGGKRLVGWDEILHPGLPLDAVIDSWRGAAALATAAAEGYDGILANGYYIDLMYPASDHYGADPLPAGSTLTAAQRVHVLGGEATMWSEWVTPETIDSRIWPRTAAIAERLWSAPDVRDIPDMYRRLGIVSGRLAEAGALHEQYLEGMLRRLGGPGLDASGLASLRELVDLIEPVKHYQRGGLQPQVEQRNPLVGLADAARADSAPSRDFAARVNRMVFAAGGIDRSEAGAIRQDLGRWADVGREVAALATDHPALAEAVPVAKGLVDACAAGASALGSLESGTPLAAGPLADARGALDRAAQANASATELPILRPLRVLVTAAAIQGERTGLSDDAWRARVNAGAFPPDAAP